MNRWPQIPLLFILLFSVATAGAQGVVGKWLAYEGADGAVLHVTLEQDGGGLAELLLVRRAQAVSYGEGSQFWGPFRTTGGYYFLLEGRKTCPLEWQVSGDSLAVRLSGQPEDRVGAELDIEYSSKDLSDSGDYKQQVVKQWKRDFGTNEDVKKYRAIMAGYLRDYYGDVFEVLVAGDNRLPLDWKRIE